MIHGEGSLVGAFSSSTKAEGKCLLYLICECPSGPFVSYIYAIDAVCLALVSAASAPRKPKPLPEPVLRLNRREYPSCMGYFSIGSLIYMIGGICSSSSLPVNHVYIYDTSTSPVVYRSSAMVFPKHDPLVIGPVFAPSSGKFSYFVLSRDLSAYDFEEFQFLPDHSCSWTALTQPPVPRRHRDSGSRYLILAHALVCHEVILFSTKDCGVFEYYISSAIWIYIQLKPSLGMLPFLGDAFFFKLGIFYGFSRNKNDIIGLRGYFPEQLIVYTGKETNYDIDAFRLQSLPLPPDTMVSQVFVARVGDDRGFCGVRFGRDGRRYDLGTKYLAAIDLFYPLSDGIFDFHRVGYYSGTGGFHHMDYFSGTYIIDDKNHGTKICACLPICTEAES